MPFFSLNVWSKDGTEVATLAFRSIWGYRDAWITPLTNVTDIYHKVGLTLDSTLRNECYEVCPTCELTVRGNYHDACPLLLFCINGTYEFWDFSKAYSISPSVDSSILVIIAKTCFTVTSIWEISWGDITCGSWEFLQLSRTSSLDGGAVSFSIAIVISIVQTSALGNMTGTIIDSWRASTVGFY